MDCLWKMVGLLIFFTGFCRCYVQNVAVWTYQGAYGPNNWPTLPIEGNDCGGLGQSPININTRAVAETQVRLTLVDHNATFHQSTLINNGRNANLVLNYNSVDNQPSLTITYANGDVVRYAFNSLHFHFGNSSDHGSEHHIDRQKFPMEMHSIYFNYDYDNYNNSIKYPDGLVVLATLYEISDEEFENGLSQITDSLSNVRSPFVNTTIPSIDLQSLFPDVLRYYEYHGSLTIPPCSQAVSWFVLKDRFPVTECQMDKFRNLLRAPLIRNEDFIAHYVANNIRPLQPLNGRIVYNRD